MNAGRTVSDIDVLSQRAKSGDAIAAWQYGFARLYGCFEHSSGRIICCRRNRRTALMWLDYAARRGCVGAMLELGAYFTTIAGKDDSDGKVALLLGLRWEKIAWDAGEGVAAANIAATYRLLGKARLSFVWLKKAHACCPWSAVLPLARAYMNGFGVRKNLVQAARLYREVLVSDMASGDDKREAKENLRRMCCS